VELVGLDLPVRNWEPGDILPLTLFWQSIEPVGADYTVFVHLLNKDGQLVAQSDGAPVGGYEPTSSWDAAELVVDRRGVQLPDALPAGDYALWVGMYAPATGKRLSVRDGDGKSQGDALGLGTVTVLSP
jgi:hypothetical protein